MKKLIICLAVMLAGVFCASAQDWSVGVGTEAVTQYLWRGMAIGASPTIVPTVTLNYEKDDFSFETGYCSITELQRAHYLEMDFWASATYKGITLLAMEQGCGHNLGLGGYDDNLELTLSYELPFEYIPASISWNTFVAGDDYNENEDMTLSRAFSTYIELNVPFRMNNFEFCATAGAVPFHSDLYETGGFALTNLSLKAGYNFTIGDNFELPLYAQFTDNPMTHNQWFVLGCSLTYTFGL